MIALGCTMKVVVFQFLQPCCSTASCLELTGQNHGQNTLQKSLQDPKKDRNPGLQSM